MQDNQKVYLHSPDTARQNGELEEYRESKRINAACAKAVDKAIDDRNYKLYHYDLATAVENVISEYGADRLNCVLANSVRYKDYDGRFSRDNREWANTVPLPDIDRGSLAAFVADAHPAILDGFINQARIYEQTEQVVDYIIRQGTENTTEGNWIMGFDEIPAELMKPWQVKKSQDNIAERLSTHKEVADIVINDGHFDVCYYLDYCPNCAAKKEEHNHFSDKEEVADDALSAGHKPSILARLQEGKKAALQDKEQSKTAPKRDNQLEV